MKLKTKYDIGYMVIDKKTNQLVTIKSIQATVDKAGRKQVQYYGAIESTGESGLYLENELAIRSPSLKSVYDLKKGDVYWVIGTYFTLNQHVYKNDSLDKFFLEQCNAFLTGEEAEAEVKRLKMRSELMSMNRGHKFSGKHDYEDFYLEVTSGNHIVVVHGLNYSPDLIYFPDRMTAMQAVDAIGEKRLLSDYFGIEDDE